MLLRNLCMGRDPPPSLSCLTPCLPTLSRLALYSDPDVSDDACFALVSLIQMYGLRLSTTLLSKLLKLQRSVALLSVLKMCHKRLFNCIRVVI